MRRPYLLAAVVVSLAVASARSSADVLEVERVYFDDAGNELPPTPVVLRVYWPGPAEWDQCIGVVGSPSHPLSVTVANGTFIDSTHFLANDRPPPLEALNTPGFEELRYDSWITIGNSSLDAGPDDPSGMPFVDGVLVAPGTGMEPALHGGSSWNGGRGGPDNVAWAVPTFCPGCYEHPPCPAPQGVAGFWPEQRVLIMQLSIVPDPGSGPLMVQGEMGLLTIVDDDAAEVAGSFSFDCSGMPETCDTCFADVTGDLQVDVQDLSTVIFFWGSGDPLGDVNHDGAVDVFDVIQVILAWGPCP